MSCAAAPRRTPAACRATSGASSRKETFTLSNGLYKVVVPVKAYHGFLDRPIERRGLEPDVAVRCTAADLSQGKDTVAEAAAAFATLNGTNRYAVLHRIATAATPEEMPEETAESACQR